jgi:hypothetical protein
MDFKSYIENLAADKKWLEILNLFKSPPSLEPFLIKTFYIHSLFNVNKENFHSTISSLFFSPNELDEILFHLLNYKFFDTAYEIINIGLSLFPNDPFILFKKSICCYYVNKFTEGIQSCDYLMLNPHTPEHIYKNCLSNQEFYINSPMISKSRIKSIPILYPFRPMNMTLLKRKDDYISIFRTINYIIDSTGKFIYEGALTSLTTICVFSPKLELLSMKDISDNKSNKYISGITGIEDCRFIDEKLIIATSCDYNKYTLPQMIIIRLSENLDISSIHPLFFQNDQVCEKNWIPLPDQNHTDKKLKFIYSFEPFIVISVDTENDYHVSFLEKIIYSISFKDIRGSTSFIEYENGYLLLVHYCKNTFPRVYYHRLCWFSKDFTKGKISSSFFFESKQIEYCTGMSITHDNKNLLFSYCINDDKTSFCLLPLDKIDSILHLDFHKL